MRKIVSKNREEKKRRRNQLTIGGILIGVMILSTLGYALQSNFSSGSSSNAANSTSITYNGFLFAYNNGYWVTSSGGRTFVFRYNPQNIPPADLSNITLKSQTIEGKPLYIYSSDVFATNEIRANLKGIAGSIESSNSSDYNCSRNSIVIENGAQEVRQSGNCVFISGQGENLISLADNVLFKILGIIN